MASFKNSLREEYRPEEAIAESMDFASRSSTATDNIFMVNNRLITGYKGKGRTFGGRKQFLNTISTNNSIIASGFATQNSWHWVVAVEFAGTTVITRQGQVTLPKAAREKSNYSIGNRLEVYFSGDLIIMKRRRGPVAVFEELAKKARQRFADNKISRKDVGDAIAAARK